MDNIYGKNSNKSIKKKKTFFISASELNVFC